VNGKCNDCSKPVVFVRGVSGYDRVDRTKCPQCCHHYGDCFVPKEHSHEYMVLEMRDGYVDVCWKCGKHRPEPPKDGDEQ
jgi:DNA-directed RNA polymerase subunit RPC12/RpoP